MITLCGFCGKEKCECETITVRPEQPGYYGYTVPNCRRYSEPITSPIILPTIVECAVLGRQVSEKK